MEASAGRIFFIAAYPFFIFVPDEMGGPVGPDKKTALGAREV